MEKPTKRNIKKSYNENKTNMEEAISLLMELHDMFRGEALKYIMR